MGNKVSVAFLGGLLVGVFLLIVPFISFGGQKVLTENGLKQAYNKQIKSIDLQIVTLEKERVNILKESIKKKGYVDAPFYVEGQIHQLNEQRKITEAAYKLLSASFE